MEEELERRREEIEAEVLRRVEEAKKVMEAQMLQEIERRKQEQIEEARKREVMATTFSHKTKGAFLVKKIDYSCTKTTACYEYG